MNGLSVKYREQVLDAIKSAAILSAILAAIVIFEFWGVASILHILVTILAIAIPCSSLVLFEPLLSYWLAKDHDRSH
jgi:hypothetical protein